MAPCDVIGVDKERWTKWADSEGVVLLFDVDFSDNATLFVYRIAVKSYGYKKNGQFSVILRSWTVLIWACVYVATCCKRGYWQWKQTRHEGVCG